jgi:hypothetical protein
MFHIISGTSKTVSGTQNVERKVPNTAHKNVPTNSLLLGTLFLLVFPVLTTSSEPKQISGSFTNRSPLSCKLSPGRLNTDYLSVFNISYKLQLKTDKLPGGKLSTSSTRLLANCGTLRESRKISRAANHIAKTGKKNT